MKIEEVEKLGAELSKGAQIPLVFVSGGDDGVTEALVELFSAHVRASGADLVVLRLDASTVRSVAATKKLAEADKQAAADKLAAADKKLKSLDAPADAPDDNPEVSDLKSDAWNQLVEVASTFPMFDEKTIIVMNGCAGGSRVPKVAKPFLEAPPPHVIMLFFGDKKTATSPLAKLAKANGRVIDFKDIREAQAKAMAVSAAREVGIALDDSAADALIDMVGMDRGAIDSALRTLAGFVGEGTGPMRVNKDDLAGLVRRTKKHAPWDVDEAIEKRDLRRAVKVAVREIQDSKDQRGRAIGLFFTVVRRVRAIAIAQELVATRTPQTEAMERLGIQWPFMYERIVAATGKYSRSELLNFLKSSLEMEIRMKRAHVGPEAQVVELLTSLMVRKS